MDWTVQKPADASFSVSFLLTARASLTQRERGSTGISATASMSSACSSIWVGSTAHFRRGGHACLLCVLCVCVCACGRARAFWCRCGAGGAQPRGAARRASVPRMDRRCGVTAWAMRCAARTRAELPRRRRVDVTSSAELRKRVSGRYSAARRPGDLWTQSRTSTGVSFCDLGRQRSCVWLVNRSALNCSL